LEKQVSDSYEVKNPYTGEIDYSFTDPSTAEISALSQQLKSSQPTWQALGVNGRIGALRELQQSLAKHQDAIVEALIVDTGRTRVANLEPAIVSGMLSRTLEIAEAALADTAHRHSQVPGVDGWESREPFGLVVNITPWNFPMILSFLDTFPALVAGNAVIIKGSEVTPRWIEAVNRAIEETPSLSPYLKILAGTGAVGAELVNHADAVAFTGSVATGEKIYRSAAENFIPVFLELGGKDPAIVLESADIDRAARTIAVCSAQSTGQACQSLERVYVAKKHYAAFVEKVVACAKEISVNYPDIDGGPIGPFIFGRQADIVADHIQDAVEKGATVHCGGKVLDHGGKWMEATVLTGVNHDMKVMTEETFGPVIPVMPFDSVDEAVQLANDTKYGLSAAVFADTTAEAQAVGARLKAGAISLNDASLNALVYDFAYEGFGSSGLGRARHGVEGIIRYTREKAYIENTTSDSVVAASFA
jgi:succinate-semialdehyde dehydrogenase/glutarate-semialdehyde dehydrogenase